MEPAFNDKSRHRAFVVPRPAGGLMDSPNQSMVREDGASESVNVWYDAWAIEKRLGCVQLGDTLATHTNVRYLWHYRQKDGTKTLLAVVDDKLYKLSGANWVGAISGANPATTADDFGNDNDFGSGLQFRQRFYYMDGGATRLVYDEGVIRELGEFFGDLPAVVIEGEVTSGGAVPDAGVYLYVYTYEDPDSGYESHASLVMSAAYTTTGDGGNDNQVVVTIPKNSDWTKNLSTINVYRTDNAGLTYGWEYSLKGVTNLDKFDHMGGLSHKADGDLGSAPPLAGQATPLPQAKIIVRYGASQTIATGNDDNPSMVYPSDPADPTRYPATQQFEVGADDGNPITGAFELQGRLYILKQSGLYSAIPNADGTWAVITIDTEVGCVDHNTIVKVGESLVYWLDRQAAYEFTGQSPRDISTDVIRDTYEKYASGANFGEAQGIHDRDPTRTHIRWLVENPDDSSKSYHLVFDYRQRIWWEEVYGATAAGGENMQVYGQFLDDNGWHLLAGDDGGRIFRLHTDTSNNDVYADAGEDYAMTWKSPYFGDGYRTLLPVYFDMELDQSPSGGTTGDLTMQVLYPDATVARSKAVTLFGSVDSSRGFRFNCPAGLQDEPRRFRVGLTHTVQAGRPRVLSYAVSAVDKGVRYEELA